MIQFKEFYDYKDETAIERLNKFIKDNKVKVIDYKYQVVTDNLHSNPTRRNHLKIFSE